MGPPRRVRPKVARGAARDFRIVVAIAIGLFITVAGVFHLTRSTSNEAGPRAAAAEPIPISSPKSLPDLAFQDAEGAPIRLEGFRGKLVVLNVWATWCEPCRKEMPALDRLQATLGGPDFEVVTLSIDRDGRQAVQDFFSATGITALRSYRDESGASTQALSIAGLPMTLLIDHEGREIARLVGPREWDGADVIAQLRRRLGRVHRQHRS